jgi:transcriptional regulator with XRE-family HTH domain
VSPTDDIAKARAALGRVIREAREHQGIDVGELAAASGISRRTITRIEAGDRESDFELLLALADGLGVRASAFFVRVDELERSSSPLLP